MSDPAGWRVELLRRAHLRDSFDCGEPALDDFLKKFASQNQDRGLCRVYVALRNGDPQPVVWGYYALSAHVLEASRFPPDLVRRFPRYPVPVVQLGRLAVHRTIQGQGLGMALLADALKKAIQAGDIIGVFAMEVLAKTPRAKSFYERAGFVSIPDDPLHLVLPLETARRLVK